MTYAAIGLFYVVYVFCRAMQQRNVAFGNYGLIVPFSFGMAAIDVFVMSSVALLGFKWSIVAAMGLGGGLGAIIAMYVHERWLRR